MLPPAFTPHGTITAGNASQLSDGAAALVVMRADRADALGLEPLAEILGHGMSASDFAYLHTMPAFALQHALKKAGRQVDEVGLLEINEAFASWPSATSAASWCLRWPNGLPASGVPVLGPHRKDAARARLQAVQGAGAPGDPARWRRMCRRPTSGPPSPSTPPACSAPTKLE